MELDPEQIAKVDPLALTNTVTLSALVGLLVRKGLFTHDELASEIRAMRARLGVPDPPSSAGR